MLRRISLAVLAVAVATALTGCLREDGTYILNEDNTVDGVILLAIDEDQTDPADPSSGLDPEGVAARFLHATVTDLGEAGWVGDRVTFVGEPITTFVTATDDWEITVSRVGTQYVVTGAAINPSEAGSKQTITDNGGSMTLKVTFPGDVADHNGSLSGRTVTWNMLTQTAAPYARGSAVPPAPVVEPDPVVTVVITPAPVASASPSPSPNASPSASPTVLTGPSEANDTSIPAWIWIVGGVLFAAVVGLSSFLLASRGVAARAAVPAPVPAPAPAPAPAPTPAPAPAPVPEAEPEAEAEPEPPVPATKPTPKVKPKPAEDTMPPASKDD